MNPLVLARVRAWAATFATTVPEQLEARILEVATELEAWLEEVVEEGRMPEETVHCAGCGVDWDDEFERRHDEDLCCNCIYSHDSGDFDCGCMPTRIPSEVVHAMRPRHPSDVQDRAALEVLRATARANLRALFELNRERVAHFSDRAKVLQRDDCVIVILDVDDPAGGMLAEALMPGEDWQVFRDRGEKPIARGLATREGMLAVLDRLDPTAAATARAILPSIPVIVVSDGVAGAFHCPPPHG